MGGLVLVGPIQFTHLVGSDVRAAAKNSLELTKNSDALRISSTVGGNSGPECSREDAVVHGVHILGA